MLLPFGTASAAALIRACREEALRREFKLLRDKDTGSDSVHSAVLNRVCQGMGAKKSPVCDRAWKRIGLVVTLSCPR
jgi:hypothetical protein